MLMTTGVNLVAQGVLKELIKVGAVTSAKVEHVDGGFVIIVRAGMEERVLGSTRSGLRLFQSLDGAASVLQSHGIMTFEVNTTHWIPRTVKNGYKVTHPAASGRKKREQQESAEQTA